MPDDFARLWLRRNGYGAIAELIDEIVTEWKTAGKRTRRNWFEILGGDKLGRRRIAAGREFPIIASVRARQGLPPTTAAIRAPAESEPPPPIVRSGRWPAGATMRPAKKSQEPSGIKCGRCGANARYRTPVPDARLWDYRCAKHKGSTFEPIPGLTRPRRVRRQTRRGGGG